MRRVTGRGVLARCAVLVRVAAAGCSDDGGGTSATSNSTSSTVPTVAKMKVTSPEFGDGGTIPTEFTCAGAGSSPELRWTAPPPDTKKLALLVFDPDAPGGGFVHYLVWGISPTVRGTQRDQYPGGLPGMNSLGNEGWVPPCPPAGAPHHYQFTVFALAKSPEFAPTANVHQFLDGIKGTVLAEGELTGLFGR